MSTEEKTPHATVDAPKREHEMSEHCWCLPTLYYVAENGNKVWVHHEPN